MVKPPRCEDCIYAKLARKNCTKYYKCTNNKANAIFDGHGISIGEASHPDKFDPAWLNSCDGFLQYVREVITNLWRG